MTQLRAEPTTAPLVPDWRVTAIFVTGVILVPVLLSILSNSWSAPDDAAYIRMAFATVAGQTIAVITVVALLIAMVVRRATPLVIGV